MDRRKFISTSCISCLGGGLMVSIVSGCGSTRMVTAPISGSDMIVPLTHFETKKGFKNYVVVQNEILQHPICIYRFNENSFKALLMKCTHQGAELQVFGDKLQCPAHGSEFNNQGEVKDGPADNDLRTFPITISDNQLKISLK